MTVAEALPRKGSRRYKMTISLNVLNHLGINLYSNVPAVLSEVVANAWDADAHEVLIDIDKEKDQIVVKDDGVGMTEEDINRRYLNVGYRKRNELPGTTPEGREPMGRKGIGKLSVFSIAKTIEVYSTKNDERHAFRMNSDDIQRAMEDPSKEDDYFPEELDPRLVDFDKGTEIVLKDLKKGLTRTAEFLRKRLARRFSIIGLEHRFEVVLDGTPITAADRGYYDKIEFLWHLSSLENLEPGFFNEQSGHRELRANVRRNFEVSGVVDSNEDWVARGWIGTVDERKSLPRPQNPGRQGPARGIPCSRSVRSSAPSYGGSPRDREPTR
jgi:hypothetical protein